MYCRALEWLECGPCRDSFAPHGQHLPASNPFEPAFTIVRMPMPKARGWQRQSILPFVTCRPKHRDGGNSGEASSP
jgi:hypothetical protein